MDEGELAIRWTARTAMGLYVLGLMLRLTAQGGSARMAWARTVWTAGCLTYLTHVAAAFHFWHHWSHAEAFAFTATQTEQMTGLDWGGGLFINYAFTLVWLTDAAWWWLRPASYESRPATIEWIVHGFMGFIAFNATVVFGQGMIRWSGLFALVMLALTLIRNMTTSRPSCNQSNR